MRSASGWGKAVGAGLLAVMCCQHAMAMPATGSLPGLLNWLESVAEMWGLTRSTGEGVRGANRAAERRPKPSAILTKDGAAMDPAGRPQAPPTVSPLQEYGLAGNE